MPACAFSDASDRWPVLSCPAWRDTSTKPRLGAQGRRGRKACLPGAVLISFLQATCAAAAEAARSPRATLEPKTARPEV